MAGIQKISFVKFGVLIEEKDHKAPETQFYFTAYTEETAKKLYPNEANAYTGLDYFDNT
ncbi:MAG: hypothetical protein P8O16_01020 [Algoriphagus sp.]|uniref:hypothetical protein n=1 Tax=Algoriphagus sp. TaxID=1872435 RepID=UPI0026050629|nr:hypothetical protein [Algoriphagus sp.]MDG1275828.1 hypothetical protein [Algoriphagus sp.]